jgi:hypothetical protein
MNVVHSHLHWNMNRTTYRGVRHKKKEDKLSSKRRPFFSPRKDASLQEEPTNNCVTFQIFHNMVEENAWSLFLMLTVVVSPNVVKSVKSVDLVSLDELGTLLVFVSSLQAHKMTNG